VADASGTEARTTPLHDVHVALDARLIDFAGWTMPVWYAGALEEHHAVRSAAGLFDLSHMAELFVTGPGAGAALDHALIVDATAMPVGRARYTMICNDAGGIIDDLITYRLSDTEFMVVANAANGPTVFAALTDRSTGFDAVVEDRTDDYALIAIQGPRAEAITMRVADPSLADLRYYRVAQLEILGQPALAARTGYTGEDGFELFVPASTGAELWHALTDVGQSDGLVPVGLAARDTLRLEAGMPLYGNELTTDTTPFDVGAARLIKDKDADWVGKEALSSGAATAHQNLIGLHVGGRRPARTGYAVQVNGEPTGVITSGTLSPTLDKLIAIARVSATIEPGATVDVDVRGKMTPATVVELPFYKRPD